MNSEKKGSKICVKIQLKKSGGGNGKYGEVLRHIVKYVFCLKVSLRERARFLAPPVLSARVRFFVSGRDAEEASKGEGCSAAVCVSGQWRTFALPQV